MRKSLTPRVYLPEEIVKKVEDLQIDNLSKFVQDKISEEYEKFLGEELLIEKIDNLKNQKRDVEEKIKSFTNQLNLLIKNRKEKEERAKKEIELLEKEKLEKDIQIHKKPLMSYYFLKENEAEKIAVEYVNVPLDKREGFVSWVLKNYPDLKKKKLEVFSHVHI